MAMRSGFGKARSRRHTVASLGVILLATCVMPGAAAAVDCNGRSFERVSVNGGSDQGDQRSLWPYLSFDGCTVAFKSDATNLVGNDVNQSTDVFVRERGTDTTTRVSVSANGQEANDTSFPPALSGDGNLVAFGSLATNLILGDTNGHPDMFVKDRTSGAVSRVSVSVVGPQPNDGSPDIPPAISDDGRFVAFVSLASNLVSGDLNETSDVFVYDRAMNKTELISAAQVGSDRGNSANGPSTAPSMSRDGRFVVFVSSARNLVSGGTDPENARPGIFLWDRQNQTMERITVTINGQPLNGESRNPTVTDDGRFVAFASDATNLVADDVNQASDVFIRDRETGTTTRVLPPQGCTLGGAAAIEGDGFSDSPSFSADGHFLVFVSAASNLVAGDTNGFPDIFVLDRTTDLIARVLGEGQAEPNGASSLPHVSGDGEWIAFQSDATNLVPDDTNNATDVFVAANPFLSGGPIPGVTPLPTCTATLTNTPGGEDTPTPTPTGSQSVTPGVSPSAGTGTPTGTPSTPTPTATPVSCENNGDCPNGQVCVNKICVPPPPCSTTDDCPDNLVCIGNMCVAPPPCSTTDDCPDNLVCVSNMCVAPPPCSTTDDCPADLICVGNQCVPGTLTPTPKSGGGGGGCGVDPQSSHQAQGTMALALPALVWILRRRSGLRRWR